MRVISGSARGTILKTIENLSTRPTTDRVKENMFNLIPGGFYDERILDLFAGSGALGLEALSRGGEDAVFVDSNPKCVSVMKENIEKCRFADKSKVLMMSVEAAFAKLEGEEAFNVVFMDPPYNKNFVIQTLTGLVKYDIIAFDGLVVIDHEHLEVLPESIEGYEKLKERKYGRSVVSIFRRI